MAITTSNAIHVAVSAFFEGMIRPSDSWRKVMDFRRDDEGSLRIAALTGVPTPGSWDGTSDLTGSQVVNPDSTGATTLSYTKYAQVVAIPRFQVMDVPGILAMCARKQGLSVASLYAEKAWAIFGDAFATETTADGKYLCATDHTTAGGSRSNKTTSALDRDSFLAAIQALREWVNYQDQIHDLAQYKKYLVVPAELEATALQIVGSSVTSSNQQLNTAGLYNTEVIVAPYLTDANDWFVVVDPTVETPITFWERAAPRFQVGEDQDSLHVRLVFDGAIAVDAGPQPDGIYGGAVT